MVAAGIIGGAGRGQGRKRKPRTASEEVAELAVRESERIKKVFRDALRSDNERTRLIAVKLLLQAEQREHYRRTTSVHEDAVDEDDFESLTGEALTQRLSDRLLAIQEGHGELPVEVRRLFDDPPPGLNGIEDGRGSRLRLSRLFEP